MAKVRKQKKGTPPLAGSKKIPKFRPASGGEAKFWDTHSPLDFPGEFRPISIKVARPLQQKRIVSVRLDEGTIEKMQKVAKRKHIGTSTLARMLIAEGLEKVAK